MRPAPPSEVAGPQGAAATGGYVAAGAPLLAVSSLRGADGVDDTAVKYLLRGELKKKKEEEERKQELADEALDDKLDAEMDALMSIGSERLTSLQNARLTALMRERAELVERRKKRRRRGRGRRGGSARLQNLLPRAAALVVDSGSGMFLDPVLCSVKFQQSHVFNCVSLRHVVDVLVVRFVQFP